METITIALYLLVAVVSQPPPKPLEDTQCVAFNRAGVIYEEPCWPLRPPKP